MNLTSTHFKKIWLASFCFLVLLMISIGGVTRLTRSGLSIVEWKPVAGIIPPLTEEDWQLQFTLYKASPEYTHVNSHFELNDYKQIFIWEYLHRVLGRIIFLFAVLPGFILWRKKLVSGRLVVLLSFMVALQGLIGWLMVKTGLNLKPHVSPSMLALHFFSALSVLLVAFYNLIKTRAPFKMQLLPNQKNGLIVFGILLHLQIFYGCITSGLKAGIGYNTYPLMNGSFFPEGGLFIYPLWLNFFENPATVQWTHRWLAILVMFTLLLIFKFFIKADQWAEFKGSLIHLLGIVGVQIILGILNIIFIVPIWLAAVHQLMATLLLISYFTIIFKLKSNEESK